MYTISGSKLDFYAPSGLGAHILTVVAWDTTGRSYTSAKAVTVTSYVPAKVSISSPTSVSTTSPLHFVASATPATGRYVVAMAVYLDNALKYSISGGSLNTYVAASTGTHNAVVQSWDNAGSVTKTQLGVTVGTSSSTLTTSSQWATDLHSTSNWLATQSSSTGALLYSSSRINPYYANLAAIGLVRDSTRYVQVESWMRWYINHLNHTDKWNLGGTMYDYDIVGGQEVSSGDADSTDSYAATFLSLAFAYYATGDPAAQSYVRSISSDLKLIASVLVKTQQSDGLTWAKPNYQIKYLMDNAEVFRGLADLATLFGSMGDTATQAYYNTLATNSQRGIWNMWLGKSWAVYKDALGRLAAPNLAVWYPDASAQVFPVLYGAVPKADTRAQQAYATFNQAWPGWPQLSYSTQDPFPWAMVGHAAALMGDSTRASAHANSLRAKWENKGFPWTWYSMEAGWFMRLASFMQGGQP
jgi:hypothetical protein